MPQLDLFPPVIDQEALKKKSPQPNFLTKESQKKKSEASDILTKAEASNDPAGVIFNDGKISVKIKSKELKKFEPKEKAQPTKVNSIPAKLPQKRGRKSLKDLDAQADLVEVPDDEILFQKQYYAISVVADWFKVNTSLLRFWENEFDILKPKKNRKGDRMFRPEDVKNLQLIYHLLREKKYTIDGAKEFLKGNKSKADTQLQLIQTLEKFKSFLLELKASL